MLRDEIIANCSGALGMGDALVDTSSRYSWRDLAVMSRHLAGNLQRAGVAPGDRVGLKLPSSAEYVVALLATWTCGASFVPIAPIETTERLAHIIADSSLRVVLSESHRPGQDDVTWLDVSDVLKNPLQEEATAEVRPAADEAYVIYTSGTSGRPKGVSVSHAALKSYIDSATRIYDLPGRRLQFASQLPVTFDAALTTLILPLTTGNPIKLMGSSGQATIELAKFLCTETGPVFIKTTPSQLSLLNELIGGETLASSGGTVVVGGEKLDFADIEIFRSHAGFRIFNEYGPTEATVGCSMYEVVASDPHAGPVPIGSPHHGASFRVDSSASPATEGELVVSGPCVASGYVDSDQRGKFSSHDGKRTYRTGDKVRVDGNGTYHYVGRLDDQVKVNGFRVELGEVESALRRVQPDGQLAALYHDGGLLAFSSHPWPSNHSGMIGLLCEHLPNYMIPVGYRIVENFPMTPHGKIDRAALASMVE